MIPGERSGICDNSKAATVIAMSSFEEPGGLTSMLPFGDRISSKYLTCRSNSGTSPIVILCCAIGCLKLPCWTFQDADDWHAKLDIDKMQRGIPLTDQDRLPWIQSLASSIEKWVVAKHDVVLACSALYNNLDICSANSVGLGCRILILSKARPLIVRFKESKLGAPSQILQN